MLSHRYDDGEGRNGRRVFLAHFTLADGLLLVLASLLRLIMYGPEVSPQVVPLRGAVLAPGPWARVLLHPLVDRPDVPSQRPRRGAPVFAVRARLVPRPVVHGLDVIEECGSFGGHKVALNAPVAEVDWYVIKVCNQILPRRGHIYRTKLVKM